MFYFAAHPYRVAGGPVQVELLYDESDLVAVLQAVGIRDGELVERAMREGLNDFVVRPKYSGLDYAVHVFAGPTTPGQVQENMAKGHWVVMED